jgi:hypothetical protein
MLHESCQQAELTAGNNDRRTVAKQGSGGKIKLILSERHITAFSKGSASRNRATPSKHCFDAC